MNKLSVLIPSRKEQFLNKTIQDVLDKASGEIEVLVNLDGYEPEEYVYDPRVVYLCQEERIGMRAGINALAAVATGNYLMKTDAHCMFEQGFDEKLTQCCNPDWVVIPRRYRLDEEQWCIRHPEWPGMDYHYLTCPWNIEGVFALLNIVWPQRDRERAYLSVDETMTFQGSCWFMSADHWDRIGPLPTENYWGWEQEPQEIGNRTWLSGGRVIVNKRVWYAHLHKGRQYGRGYFLNKIKVNEGHEFSTRYWLKNSWEGQIFPFEWLVERFWPVPTWAEDWRERLAEVRNG